MSWTSQADGGVYLGVVGAAAEQIVKLGPGPRNIRGGGGDLGGSAPGPLVEGVNSDAPRPTPDRGPLQGGLHHHLVLQGLLYLYTGKTMTE